LLVLYLHMHAFDVNLDGLLCASGITAQLTNFVFHFQVDPFHMWGNLTLFAAYSVGNFKGILGLHTCH
jgi:hypothetical protein